jgi:hypothetical protein
MHHPLDERRLGFQRALGAGLHRLTIQRLDVLRKILPRDD